MTVVNHETGEIVETIGADEARRLTTEAQNEFRSGAAHTARAWELVEEAVMGGGHIDLGYRSPGDYLQAEFDGVLAGFNIAERRLAVRTMTGWGLSTRAIAKPLGVSNKTVHADLNSGVTPGNTLQTPEPVEDGEADAGSGQTLQGDGDSASGEDAPAPTEDPAPAPRPAVVGIDGKTYTRPEPKAAPRKALTDSFWTAAYDTRKKVESLHRLINDDRFPRNAEKVAANHRNDLLRIKDLLEQVINALPNEEEASK